MFKALVTSCIFTAALSGGLAAAQTDAETFYDTGSILARARFAAVSPENFSSSISEIGGHVQATTAYIPELDLSYFLSPNLSVEAIAGTSRHEVSAHDSALGPKADVGSVWVPPDGHAAIPSPVWQFHPLRRGWADGHVFL